VSRRLPVIGTTAATTAFVHETLDLGSFGQLHLDGNGKITAGNGTLDRPRPNALSLPQIASCPGSTPTCRASCYVHNLQTAQPDLHALYVENAATLAGILDDAAATSDVASQLGEWIASHAAAGFRWHVSGDVMSRAHAEFISETVFVSGTPHWIYTRSFEFLGPLVDVCQPGWLTINLSCDRDNYGAARAAFAANAPATGGAMHLAYLTVDGAVPDDLPDDAIVFPDYNLRPRQFATLAESPWWQGLSPRQRAMVCPVDAHGKAENRRCGPCRRCLE